MTKQGKHVQLGRTATRIGVPETIDDEAAALEFEFLTWDDVAGSVADAVHCAMCNTRGLSTED